MKRNTPQATPSLVAIKRRQILAVLKRCVGEAAKPCRAAVLAAVALAAPGMSPVAVSTHVAPAGEPCDVYIPSCGRGLCDCGHRGAHSGTARRSLMKNPLYRTLDTVAGGIESVLGLNKCTHTGCDGIGCDAAPHDSFGTGMSQEWSGPVVHAHPHAITPPQAAPARPRTSPQPNPPRLPAVPELPDSPEAAEMVPPTEAIPRATMPRPLPQPRRQETSPRRPLRGEPQTGPAQPPATEMSSPRIVPSQPAVPNEVEPTPAPKPKPKEAADPFPSENIPDLELPEMPLPQRDPAAPPSKPEAKNPKANPFDTLPDVEELNDPFSDDAARLRSRSFQPTTPTGLRSSAMPPRRAVHPMRYGKPGVPALRLQPPAKTSAAPVGSGLRPVTHVGPLRPVNHEEPVGLAPLGGGSTVPPYRPSRR